MNRYNGLEVPGSRRYNGDFNNGSWTRRKEDLMINADKSGQLQWLAVAWFVCVSASSAWAAPSDAGARIAAVRRFADMVLEHGRDAYREDPTPLFVDGVNVDTLEPVRWHYEGASWICSNLASQQNLFRTLVALTNLTGDPSYKAAAKAAIAWHFEHLTRPCGLLQWGGHRFVDLATGDIVGEQDAHELKWSFPYYELMWEVDPEATGRYIEAFWNAHILDWELLDMNRHGRYGSERGTLWNNVYVGGEPFFPARGLTFLNTGSDLMYAGIALHALSGDEGAAKWSLRLMKRYVDARNPFTGLGAYQYSQLANDNDRALRQFAIDFPGQVVLEGTMLTGSGIYSRGGVSQLLMAEQLGEDGREMLGWVRDGLVAYAEQAYVPETNTLIPILTDGTRLTESDVRRVGYYSAGIGRESRADALLFYAYALGFRLTNNETLWNTARHIGRGHGLGDLGAAPGEALDIDLATDASAPELLFGVLELIRAAPQPEYQELALRLGENILDRRCHNGFFLPSPNHVNANFDVIEPLALLTLEAHVRGVPEAAPAWPGGRGYIHGPHDGVGRTTDWSVIWSQTRN